MVLDLLKIGIPSSIMYFFSMLMETINLAIAGHLNDPSKIAGVGIANVYINIVA